jgi:hypothetical protein
MCKQRRNDPTGLPSVGIDWVAEQHRIMEEQKLEAQMAKLQLMTGCQISQQTGAKMRCDGSMARIVPPTCELVRQRHQATYTKASSIRR